MWSLKCGAESGECEVWSVGWRVWSAECGVRSVKCDVRRATGGEESGGYEVWSSKRTSDLFQIRFRALAAIFQTGK